MKKNVFYLAFVLVFALISNIQVYGQSANKSIVLKKGEVLDILLISQNPNPELDLKSYFKDVFPVGTRLSYQSMTSLKIKSYTQGNHQPSALIFGKWADVKKRKDFLNQILDEVPDFHERRRKIWSYFGLIYFEMQEDVSFEVDQSKYHIATSYWLSEKKTVSKFYKKWASKMAEMGGESLIVLSDGTSPFGYKYNPDYFVISSWKDEASFKAFQAEMKELKIDNIEHISEFVLD